MTRDEAVAAVKASPKDAQAWLQLGQVLAEEGAKGKARECFERALSLDPLLSEAHQALTALDASPAGANLPRWLQGAEVSVPPPASMQSLSSPVPPERPSAPRSPWPILLGGLLGLALTASVVLFAIQALRPKSETTEAQATPVATTVAGAAITHMATQQAAVGATLSVSCREESGTFISQTEALFDDWDDANALADTTSRIALSGPVGTLQGIRRQVSDLQPPECALLAKSAMETYMDRTIEMYLAFMGQAEDGEVNALRKQADEALAQFVAVFAQLQEGQETLALIPTATPRPPEDAFAANYIASQEQGGVEITIARVMVTRKELDSNDFSRNASFRDAEVVGELIFLVTNKASESRIIAPQLATVIIGDEFIVLDPLFAGFGDRLMTELAPGDSGIVGAYFPIKSSSVEDVRTMVIQILGPDDPSGIRVGDDFRFELDLDNTREFEPLPEELIVLP